MYSEQELAAQASVLYEAAELLSQVDNNPDHRAGVEACCRRLSTMAMSLEGAAILAKYRDEFPVLPREVSPRIER